MLTRRLYRLGYTRTQILQLYHFIDWLLQLPPDLEAQTLRQIKAFEEEEQVNYISYAERVGIEEGRQRGREEGRVEGRLEGPPLALDVKFGPLAEPLLPEIRQLRDLAQIEAGPPGRPHGQDRSRRSPRLLAARIYPAIAPLKTSRHPSNT